MADNVSETDSSENEEGEQGIYYWNNWTPQRKKIKENQNKDAVELVTFVPRTRKVERSFCKHAQNYIPPNISRSEICSRLTVPEIILENNAVVITELHDVRHKKDGDEMFGFFEASILDKIKVSKDENGHVTCWAGGVMEECGKKEKSLVCTKEQDMLMKLLDLTPPEWGSLIESIQNNSQLNFQAYSMFNIDKSTSIEKLWFLMCKRRHYLPMLLVKVQLCGLVKLESSYEVVSKLIILDVIQLTHTNFIKEKIEQRND